jgi:hypothetical protein
MAFAITVVSAAPSVSGMDYSPPISCARATNPNIIAMSPGGDVAAIFPKDYVYGTGASYVFWRQPNGTVNRLPLPSNTLLLKTFRVHNLTSGAPAFQDVYFRSIRLTDTGMPVATVVSHFSGAYSGLEVASFVWTRGEWSRIPPVNAGVPRIGGWPVNTSVAAAVSTSSATFNLSFDRFGYIDAGERSNPNYKLDQVALLKHGAVFLLGPGTATSQRGNFVGGFQAGLNPFAGPGPSWCGHPRISTTALWRGDKLKRLGHGIIYDVDSSGVAVGDDQQFFGAQGRPVLWLHGQKKILSEKAGSAYALSSKGIIVGTIGATAFWTTVASGAAGVRRLDDLLIDRSWHVTAAYAVDTAGSILALARRRDGPLELVILTKSY